MSWQVHGTDVEFSAASQLVQGSPTSGVVISGMGRQYFQTEISGGAAYSKLYDLPALWSLRQASRATEYDACFGCVSTEANIKIDLSEIRSTTVPVSFVSYFGQSGDQKASIGFRTFLSDVDFYDVWKLMKLIATGAPYKYGMNYGHIGFLPRRVTQEDIRIYHFPDLNPPLSFPDWLAGVPCRAETFSLHVMRREPKDGNSF